MRFCCRPFCRLDKCALLQFLESSIFVNVISVLSLAYLLRNLYILKWKYDGIIYLTIIRYAAQIWYSSKFQRAHESNGNSCGYCFISFEKVPRECSQWSCYLPTLDFLNCCGLKFSVHTKAVTIERCSVKKSVLKNFANFTR